jgi:hypothetical protein
MVTTNSYISIDRLEYNNVLDTLHIHTTGRKNEEKRGRERERERRTNSIPFPI